MSTRTRRSYLPAALLTLALALGLPWLTACAADSSDPAEGDEHTARMAAEHEGDEPVPGATRDMEDPGGEVTTERVVYATLDGGEVTGYLARPADSVGEDAEALPGILLIHEWWGLNDNIETTARLLARHGYAALAVDLYGGEVATDPEGARGLMSSVDRDQAQDNLRQAHAYLTETLGAPTTGVVGWCFGGGWSLQSALLMPELDAAVMYYGRVVTDSDQLATLETPLLGLFGSEDQGIPLEGVEAMETTLDELGKDAEIVIYEGAGHAFANPSGTRYEPEAAKDAWEKTIAFFAANLKG